MVSSTEPELPALFTLTSCSTHVPDRHPDDVESLGDPGIPFVRLGSPRAAATIIQWTTTLSLRSASQVHALAYLGAFILPMICWVASTVRCDFLLGRLRIRFSSESDMVLASASSLALPQASRPVSPCRLNSVEPLVG